MTRLLRSAIGDDGVGAIWEGLTPEGREVMRLAFSEARQLGHPCLAGEHLMLGVLHHATSRAAALLQAQGLDLATARAELERVGPTLGPGFDPAPALGSLGIAVEEVHRRLEATFGAAALEAAERRVRRRPRWRGGHARPRPLCIYLLARPSLEVAIRLAHRRGDAAITPEHLLYGALEDARHPLGTRLDRSSRRQLATVGWTSGRPNPVRLVLEARGISPAQLAAALNLSP